MSTFVRFVMDHVAAEVVVVRPDGQRQDYLGKRCPFTNDDDRKAINIEVIPL